MSRKGEGRLAHGELIGARFGSLGRLLARAGGGRPLGRLGFFMRVRQHADQLGRALRSGKEAASLPLPPLRTGLDGFPSSGSSRV